MTEMVQRDFPAIFAGVECADQRFEKGEVGEGHLSPGHEGGSGRHGEKVESR